MSGHLHQLYFYSHFRCLKRWTILTGGMYVFSAKCGPKLSRKLSNASFWQEYICLFCQNWTKWARIIDKFVNFDRGMYIFFAKIGQKRTRKPSKFDNFDRGMYVLFFQNWTRMDPKNKFLTWVFMSFLPKLDNRKFGNACLLLAIGMHVSAYFICNFKRKKSPLSGAAFRFVLNLWFFSYINV